MICSSVNLLRFISVLLDRGLYLKLEEFQGSTSLCADSNVAHMESATPIARFAMLIISSCPIVMVTVRSLNYRAPRVCLSAAKKHKACRLRMRLRDTVLLYRSALPFRATPSAFPQPQAPSRPWVCWRSIA